MDEGEAAGHLRRLYRALGELALEPDPKFDEYSPSCISRNDFDGLEHPQLRKEVALIGALLKCAADRAVRTVHNKERLDRKWERVRQQERDLEKRLREIRERKDEIKNRRKILRHLGPAPPKKKVATARRPQSAKKSRNRSVPQPNREPTKKANQSQAKSDREGSDE